MKLNQTIEAVTTAVSIHGGWVKLLQSRQDSRGAAALLGIKARRVPETDEAALVQTLKELAQSLPESPRDVVGLFSSDALFTRYLALPSQDPVELRAMALYQMEGTLPYPLQECVVSVRPLGPRGEATQVLVAAAHRPDLERLLRICRQAGLSLTRVASSTEAIGRWHQACRPGGGPSSEGWLAAEFTEAGLDLGVFSKGSLVYVRHVPHLSGDLEELAARLEETAQAYQKEQIGPRINRITLSGRLDLMPAGALERLEAALALPVNAVDPLESSPFKDTLALAAKEILPEVSFSDLLGVVCAPRVMELDLLPDEVREEQERRALGLELRRTLLLAGLALLLAAGWAAARTAAISWTLRSYQAELQRLEPQAARVQKRAELIRAVASARDLYGSQIRWIGSTTRHLTPGMTLQFLGVEGDRMVMLRAVAPDWAALSAYSAALRGDPAWKRVALRSARLQEGRGNVEFELALVP